MYLWVIYPPNLLNFSSMQLEKSRGPIGFSIAVVATVGLALWLLDFFTEGSGFWKILPVCEETECFFCERPRFSNFVRQPINTFSNFGFLLFGVYGIFVGLNDRKKNHPRNTIEADPSWSFAYGFTGIFLFLGSSLFHASLTTEMEYLDLAGVYMLCFFPLAFNFRWIIALHKGRKRLAKTRWVLTGWLALCFILPVFMYEIPVHGIIFVSIALVAGSLIYLEWKFHERTNKWFLVLSMVFILGAMSFFAMDVSRWWCNPYGWFQPHAIWHLLAAGSAFFFYLYARSERR